MYCNKISTNNTIFERIKTGYLNFNDFYQWLIYKNPKITKVHYCYNSLNYNPAPIIVFHWIKTGYWDFRTFNNYIEK